MRRGRPGAPRGLLRRRGGCGCGCGGGAVGHRGGRRDRRPLRHRGRRVCSRRPGGGGAPSGQPAGLLRQGRTSRCTSHSASHCRCTLISLTLVQRDDLARQGRGGRQGGRSRFLRLSLGWRGDNLGRRGGGGLALGGLARREQRLDKLRLLEQPMRRATQPRELPLDVLDVPLHRYDRLRLGDGGSGGGRSGGGGGGGDGGHHSAALRAGREARSVALPHMRTCGAPCMSNTSCNALCVARVTHDA